MFGKKSSYVRFSFYEHFNRQFTYAIFLYSKSSDVSELKTLYQCILYQQRFIDNYITSRT